MVVTNTSFANYCFVETIWVIYQKNICQSSFNAFKTSWWLHKSFKPKVSIKTEKWLLTSHLEFKTSEFKSPAWKILSFLFIIWFSQYHFFLKYKLFCSMFLRENKIYHFFWPMISSIHIVSKIVVSKLWIYSNICPCFKKTIFPPLFQLPSLRSEEKW